MWLALSVMREIVSLSSPPQLICIQPLIFAMKRHPLETVDPCDVDDMTVESTDTSAPPTNEIVPSASPGFISAATR